MFALFFSYGHIRNQLLIYIPILGKHRILGPIWVGLAILVIFVILNNPSWHNFLNQILNLILGSGLLITMCQLTWQEVRTVQAALNANPNEKVLPLILPVSKQAPDIYYIILDTYGRDDVLQAKYNYDNSKFLNELKDMGFVIPECSKANYPITVLSLASSLNFSYLTDVKNENARNLISNSGQDMSSGGIYPYYQELIRNSAVRKNLEQLGYKTVAFETPFHWLNISNSSSYYQNTRGNYFNQFELLLIKTTASQILWDGIQIKFPDYYFQTVASSQLFILENLPKTITLPGPKFVFVHIGIPHAPYIYATNGDDPIRNQNFYAKNGQPINNDWLMRGYRNNVDFINSRIVPILSQIIKQTAIPPVIVVQGDHGPIGSGDTRMPILNAYYLPGVDSSQIYASISPVNTFRIIFDSYFGGNLTLLPDQSYYFKDTNHPLDLLSYSDDMARCKSK